MYAPLFSSRTDGWNHARSAMRTLPFLLFFSPLLCGGGCVPQQGTTEPQRDSGVGGATSDFSPSKRGQGVQGGGEAPLEEAPRSAQPPDGESGTEQSVGGNRPVPVEASSTRGGNPKGVVYGESAVFLPGDQGHYRAIMAAFAGGSEKTQLLPRYSRPLSRLARRLRSFGGQPVSPGSLLKVAAQYGIATPWISQAYLIATGHTDAIFHNWIKKSLALYITAQRVTHFGFAIVDGKRPGERVGILLMQRRKVRLHPFGQTVGVGQALQLSGRVAPEVKRLEILVTYPGGRVTRKRFPLSGGRFGFKYRFCTPGGEGHYSVELMGTDASGPVVLALFPIACGGHRYMKSAQLLPKKAPSQLSAQQASRAIFLGINAYRAKRKQAPLKWSGAVAQVSVAHSLEMCKAKKIFHVSPKTGAPDKRVKRAGIRTTLVAENVAVASSPEAVVESWIMSEGHRLNMLLRDGVYGGVGVCVTQIGGSNHYYATFVVIGKRP